VTKSLFSQLIKLLIYLPIVSFFIFLELFGDLVISKAPKVQWHREYNGSGDESHPHYVIKTSDEGFLMVGETGFIDDLTAKIFVVKTDSKGNLLWEKEFGTPGYNLGNCAIQTFDGNYALAGCLNYNAALIKLNAESGKVLWQKTWDLGSEDAFEGLDATPDGGFIVTGYKNGLAENTFLNWGEGILIKTDERGRMQWKQDLSSYMSSGYRVRTIPSGYMLSGHPHSEGNQEFNLLKTDFKGKILWSRAFNTVYWGFDMDSKGNMILAGHTRMSPLSQNWDIEVIKLDPLGKVLWTRYFGQPRGYDGKWIHDEVWGARASLDGGWVIVAGTGDETNRYEVRGHPSGPSGEWKIYLIKTNSDGDLEWEGIYGIPDGDWAGEDLCLTKDGGALVANDCGSFGFTKLGPFLNPRSKKILEKTNINGAPY
jgi:hypothetical protein